jgi:hypothetical protein
MAEPTQNYCPKVADLKMMQDVANDLSIASAVKGTHVSSTLYTDFDNLRNNANTDLIHSSFGTVGVTPTESNHFRGYPRPTLDLNYQVIHTGTFPNEQYEFLQVTPTLNGKLGYDLTVSVICDQFKDDSDGALLTSSCTFTFNAGSTVPDSFTVAVSLGGNNYRINTQYVQPGDAFDIHTETNASTTLDVDLLLVDSDPFITMLEYTAASPVFSHTLQTIDALNCSGAASGTDITAYSLDSTLANGSTLYTTNQLTTTIADDDYAFNIVDDTIFDFGSTTSGVISGFTSCP